MLVRCAYRKPCTPTSIQLESTRIRRRTGKPANSFRSPNNLLDLINSANLSCCTVKKPDLYYRHALFLTPSRSTQSIRSHWQWMRVAGVGKHDANFPVASVPFKVFDKNNFNALPKAVRFS